MDYMDFLHAAIDPGMPVHHPSFAGRFDGHRLARYVGAGTSDRSKTDIGAELHPRRTEPAALFAEHRGDDGKLAMPAEKVVEANRRNDEITALAKAYEAAPDLDAMAAANAAGIADLEIPGQPLAARDEITQPTFANASGRRSIGELFVASVAYQQRPKASGATGPVVEIDLEKQFGKSVASRGLAALFDTATGYAPETVRLPTPLTPLEERLTVADLMPQGRTSQNAVPFMEETTSTNTAAETAEGALKPEAEIAFTEKTSPVRKVAVTLPVTDESLEDVPFIESYLNTRLRTFVLQREDQQLLAGDGAGVNLRGLLNTSGILTQAKGADPTPDAFYKAMTKIRAQGFLEPTGAVVHPNDWQDVRLLRTADGIYIWGNPSEAGPERIWGINAVQTTRITENTGLVGAFRDGAMIARRSEVSMQIGWVNDQFRRNQRTILVEERLALIVFRPKGFCTVTGI